MVAASTEARVAADAGLVPDRAAPLLAEAFAAMSGGVALFDETDGLVLANPAVARLLAHEAPELAPGTRLERFLALNGLAPNSPLLPGQ